MQILYDPDGDVLETRLSEEKWVKAVDISPSAIAHVDGQGRVASLEVLWASEAYPLDQLVLYSQEPLKSLAELAPVLKVGPDVLKHAAQQGSLKAVKVGRNWASTRSWVLEYARKSRKSRKRFSTSEERSALPRKHRSS